MKILVTGATGFIGTNLVNYLKTKYSNCEFLLTNSKTSETQLRNYAKVCNEVYYFAAVHRSNDNEDFRRYNTELLRTFLKFLEDANNRSPILFTSSRQANENSPYGISKIESEQLVWNHACKCDTASIVYRLTNTFGRFARPNGHSVVATFCYNIQHGLPIVINNPHTLMRFYYIDDVVLEFEHAMNDCIEFGKHIKDRNIYRLPDEKVYSISVGELAEKIQMFKQSRDNHIIPVTNNIFESRLLYTFDSYI